MKCDKCGSTDTWTDDDLHWTWCKNPKCIRFYGKDKETMQEYFAEIQRKEIRALEMGDC